MSRTKVIVPAFIAVLAFGALASGSASAATAGWMVNGTNLSGSAALATTATVHERFLLSALGLNIECSGNLNAVRSEIKSPNKGFAQELAFTMCSTTNVNCEVPSSILTVPILAEATLDSANVLAINYKLKPETGTVLVTVSFKGEKCALSGSEPITGKVTALLPTGQDERTAQSLVVNVTAGSGELFIASAAATLKGSALLKLQSGAPWSFL
jgi:hypothetical protein